MKARDIMTSNPLAVTPGEPISRAAELMRDVDVGLIPVVDDTKSMRLVGVITDRDISVRCVAKQHSPSCVIRDHMTKGPIDTVRPDDDVETALSLMKRDQVRRIPVVSEDNHLVGIIAQADLATTLGPTQPQQVQQVLEQVSQPRETITPIP